MNSDEKQFSANPPPSEKQKAISSRREFIKATAMTSTVATTLLASSPIAALAAESKPASGRAQPEPEGMTPPQVAAGAHDAMPAIISRVNHESGLPLGGIGTGSIRNPTRRLFP